MPTYSYITEDPEKSCHSCRKGFDLFRPLSRPPLTECPLCKNPVKKQITTFSTPKASKPFSYSRAKSAGFTVMKKTCDGTYENL
jgi:putative FmdB family regulatory protein